MNNNPFSTPVAWNIKAYNDAIYEVLNYNALPKEKQTELEKEMLDAQGGNIDLEKLKKWVYATQDENIVKQIEKKTTTLLKRREEKNKKDLREDEKKFDDKIKQAAKTFAQDYVDFAEEFFKQQPFYYDEARCWWLWDSINTCWSMSDETYLLNEIYDSCKQQGIQITRSSIKSEILTSMKMVGRKHKPKDVPVKWVQFKDKAFSLTSGELHDVTPDYFFTNPIPWEIGNDSKTPTLDKLFTEWVGKEHLNDLYEFIAYCCYRSYPIQLLFCLYGHGRNGKSTFINIVDKFLGTKNTCTTDLDMIAGKNKNRFETMRLYKKLACFMGETNFNILENSSILKKLVGGDKIGYEIKGAGLFDDYNYAKIIIASNSLPSSEDTSEGFYRRWHIIDFPNEFPEGKDIILNVPNSEFSVLANKVTKILPKLLENGSFSHQGTIQERKNKYIMASNPLPYFLEKCCYHNPIEFVRYSELYMSYTKFLAMNKRRIVSKKEFSKILIAEGLENRKTSKEGLVDFYVEGIKLKDDLLDLPDFQKVRTHLLCEEGVIKNGKSSKSSKCKEEFVEDVISDEELVIQLDELKGEK